MISVHTTLVQLYMAAMPLEPSVVKKLGEFGVHWLMGPVMKTSMTDDCGAEV